MEHKTQKNGSDSQHLRSLEDMDWTEKYRPKNLGEVMGNLEVVRTMKRWGQSWKGGVPEKKALILYGPPGVGKTSAALALAAEMDWRVIELNASDTRNAESIKNVSGATLYESFSDEGAFTLAREGKRTLLVFDEADNLYVRRAASEGEAEFTDTGGKEEIIKTIVNTRQPVILIANDYYQLTKNSPLKRLCLGLRFNRLNPYSMRKALALICRKEDVDCTPDALDWLVRQAGGDLRGAINDLQSAARVGGQIDYERVADLGLRDTSVTIFDAMEKIFKSEDPLEARKITFNLDESPDHLLAWIDENIPREFKHPQELKNAMESIGRADMFLGRVRRRQSYKLWSYAYDLMTMGVNTARLSTRRKDYVRYSFPTYIRRMAGTKEQRRLKKSLIKKLMNYCHTSRGVVNESILPSLSEILRRKLEPSDDKELDDLSSFREVAGFVKVREFDEKETAFLLGLPAKHPVVKTLLSVMNEEKAQIRPSPKDKKTRLKKRAKEVSKPPVEAVDADPLESETPEKKEEAQKKEEKKDDKSQMSLDAWG